MPKTPKEDGQQIDKFKEAAKQVGTDDSEKAFDRTLKKLAKTPASNPRAKSANK